MCNGVECDDWYSEKCQIMSRVGVEIFPSHAFIQYAVLSHNRGWHRRIKAEMTHLSRGQKSR